MANKLQEKVLEGIFGVMCCVARIFLRFSIGYREFSDLAKAAFVQVATDDYGIRGRPTNVSRVAVMTGLTRKEVKRIRDLGTGFGDAFISKRNPQAELLHYWNTDPRYSDAQGNPIDLSMEGDAPSFRALVRRCAGDIPPGAMKTELKRIGAIAVVRNGLLRVQTREHLPSDAEGRLMIGIDPGLRTLAATIAFNSDPADERTRSQKFVDSPKISKTLLPSVQKELEATILEFAVMIDDRLSEIESDDSAAHDDELTTVGVGIYFYADE